MKCDKRVQIFSCLKHVTVLAVFKQLHRRLFFFFPRPAGTKRDIECELWYFEVIMLAFALYVSFDFLPPLLSWILLRCQPGTWVGKWVTTILMKSVSTNVYERLRGAREAMQEWCEEEEIRGRV